MNFTWTPRRSVGLALFIAGTQACSESPADPGGLILSITSDRSTYSVGDPVFVTLHNKSTETVVLNTCAGDFEYWDGEAWEAQLQRACTLVAPSPPRQIVAGELVQDTFDTPVTLPLREYRILYDIDELDGSLLPELERASNTFEMGG